MKTHDLVRLVDEASRHDPAIATFRDVCILVTGYYEAVIDVRHGMEYRLVLNGKQVIDLAADGMTTPEYYEMTRSGTDPPHLNSVFWDFDLFFLDCLSSQGKINY